MRHWQHSGCVMATPHLGASSSVRLIWHSWVRRNPGAEPAHAQTVAGNTVPVAESTLRALTESEGPRIVAFGLDRPGGDPTYKCVRSACAPSHLLGDIVTSQSPSITLPSSPPSYFNIYRDGDAKEAVQITSDAAFSALEEWLKQQQALVEAQFKARPINLPDGEPAHSESPTKPVGWLDPCLVLEL